MHASAYFSAYLSCQAVLIILLSEGFQQPSAYLVQDTAGTYSRPWWTSLAAYLTAISSSSASTTLSCTWTMLVVLPPTAIKPSKAGSIGGARLLLSLILMFRCQMQHQGICCSLWSH